MRNFTSVLFVVALLVIMATPVTATSSTGTAMSVPSAYYWGGVTSDSTGSYLVAAQSDVSTQTADDGLIYYSQDGGTTWTASNAPAMGWSSITASNNGQYVLASAVGVMYLSTNYGVEWTKVTLSYNPSFAQTSAMSSSGEVMVSANTNSGCVSISSNYGVDWVGNLGPAGTSVTTCQAIAVSSDGTSIVLSVENEGLYLSTDTGLSWSLQCSFPQEISSVAYGGGLFYATMSDSPYSLLTSTDGGSTWITASTGTGSAMYTISVDSTGTKLFVTAVNGLWYSTDSGASFDNINRLNWDVEVATMNSGANAALWTTQYQFGIVPETLYFGDPSTKEPTDDTTSSTDHIGAGIIAGIVIGAVILLCLAGGSVYWFRCRVLKPPLTSQRESEMAQP